jgi:Acetyltransferase (GNAT) domain
MDNLARLSESTAPAGCITVSCHVNEVPAFVEPALILLYGNYRSSLPFFRIYLHSTANVSTYVARRDGEVIAVLLFEVKSGIARILNEMIPVDEAEVARFAHCVFENFDNVWAINFRAIQTDVRRLAFPFQRHTSQDRFPVALPATPEEYTAQLGKSTRDIIKRYQKKLMRDFPSFSSRSYVNEEIDEQDIRTIIKLSEARIASKKKRFGIDAEEQKAIIALAKVCGFVHVIRIDGRVCAGTINYRAGASYFLEVVGHDPALNDHRLGTICCYSTLCECIVRGGRTYDFGGGWNHYKLKFLGVQQNMDRVEIYRSHSRMALKCARVMKTFIQGRVRRLKVWLLTHEKSLATRTTLHAYYLVRSIGKRTPL